MKLYTEEQVRKAIYKARALSDWWDIEYQFETNDIIDSLTPIELPSDEEMEKKLCSFDDVYVYGYYAAINMIEEQIKQQDKNNP